MIPGRPHDIKDVERQLQLDRWRQKRRAELEQALAWPHLHRAIAEAKRAQANCTLLAPRICVWTPYGTFHEDELTAKKLREDINE